MTSTPNTHNDHVRKRRYSDGSALPLAIRQRLWDQLWQRLLASPVDPADKAPVPASRDGQDGGER